MANGTSQGQFELGTQKHNWLKTYQLERALGLKRGSLQDGFRITEINDITYMNPRLPTPMEGNKYFKFGLGLPAGGPEIIIDSIPTGGK